MMLVCLMHTSLFLLHVMICSPYLSYATCLALFVSLDLNTLIYMFMHEFLCVFVSSILHSHETIDTQSKPTFVLLRHCLLFDNVLVYPFVCLTYLFALVWLSLLVSLCMLSLPFCYLLGQRMRPPMHEQKGQGRKQEDASPERAIFSRLGGLVSSSGFLSFS